MQTRALSGIAQLMQYRLSSVAARGGRQGRFLQVFTVSFSAFMAKETAKIAMQGTKVGHQSVLREICRILSQSDIDE